MSAVEEHKPVEKRRALGRGLDSLLPSGPRPVPVATPAAVPPVPVVIPTNPSAEIAEIHAEAGRPAPAPQPSAQYGQEVVEIALEVIDHNPYQTRRMFDEAALQELASSIRESGLAQPVVVRPGANGRYILVLGERRCRASKMAGKTSVPAIVRELGNEQAAELTVIENLQRQDLNCLEQAQAFARLSREFNLTQEQIAKRVGTSRESVANHMRLLKLPQPVLDLIGAGQIGFSEARVLLEGLMHTTDEAIVELAETAARLGWTVRDLKYRVERLVNPELNRAEQRPEKKVDPNVVDAERRLRESLGMRVRVTSYQGNKGQVVIRYESLADFDRIFERLSKEE